MRKIFILQSVDVEINERKTCFLGLEATWIGTFSFSRADCGFCPHRFVPLRELCGLRIKREGCFSVSTHLWRFESWLNPRNRPEDYKWGGQKKECGVLKFTLLCTMYQALWVPQPKRSSHWFSLVARNLLELWQVWIGHFHFLNISSYTLFGRRDITNIDLKNSLENCKFGGCFPSKFYCDPAKIIFEAQLTHKQLLDFFCLSYTNRL